MEFSYYMPTKIISGRGCVRKNYNIIKNFGRNAFIVTGKNSAVKCGALEDVIFALKKNGQNYTIFDGVVPNPPVSCVRCGAELAKQSGADFIIAIGGGSPMDAGKAIALLAMNDIPNSMLFSVSYDSDALPVVCIPTTAGTGSEVTKVAVLTFPEKETKYSVNGSALFAKVAFLDGKYTESLELDTTINTAVDALSHAVEGMLSKAASPMSDILGMESIKIISSRFGTMLNDKITPYDRDALLYASALAGIVIANTGTNVVHAMGYSLTYFKNIDHGRANGLLFAEYLKFVEKKNSEKIRMILNIMGLGSTDEFAEVMDSLLGKKELVTNDDVARYTKIVQDTKSGSLAKCISQPVERDIVRIYKNSFNLM